jgi:transcriptional regulator with XRE-family HTH domain
MDGISLAGDKGFNVSASELSRRFGDAVRRERVKAGLSQEALAERAGLHPTYISMVERGVRNATLEVAGRLARGLEMSLLELIAETVGPAGRGRRR